MHPNHPTLNTAIDDYLAQTGPKQLANRKRRLKLFCSACRPSLSYRRTK